MPSILTRMKLDWKTGFESRVKMGLRTSLQIEPRHRQNNYLSMRVLPRDRDRPPALVAESGTAGKVWGVVWGVGSATK